MSVSIKYFYSASLSACVGNQFCLVYCRSVMVVAFSVVSISNCSLEIPRCDSELTGEWAPPPLHWHPSPFIIQFLVPCLQLFMIFGNTTKNVTSVLLYVTRGVKGYTPYSIPHQSPPPPGLLRRRLPMVFVIPHTLGNPWLTQRIISCMSSDECEFLMLVMLSHLTAVPLALCLVYEFGIACHRFCISCSPITLSFLSYVWFVSDDGELYTMPIHFCG